MADLQDTSAMAGLQDTTAAGALQPEGWGERVGEESRVREMGGGE